MEKTWSQASAGSLAWRISALGQAIRNNMFSLVIAFLLMWVVAAPIVMLLLSSVREGSFITPGALTLNNYKTVYLAHSRTRRW